MDKSVQIAIISGVAVISGVVISQAISLFLSSLDKKHKKQILLRQKYEEMMFYFSDSLEWLKTLHSASGTRQNILQQSPSPESRKVLSLCLLYFPDIVDHANQYILSQVNYFEFVAGSYDESLKVNAGGQALVLPEGKKLLAALCNKKDALENLIVNNVNKYIQA